MTEHIQNMTYQDKLPVVRPLVYVLSNSFLVHRREILLRSCRKKEERGGVSPAHSLVGQCYRLKSSLVVFSHCEEGRVSDLRNIM